MTDRARGRGALVLRLLGVLGVVAGVFAMHGLTAHHQAAMVAAPTQAHATVSMQMADPSGVQIAPAADEHEMVGACVAILTGLALLLALLLGLRNLLAWRPVVLLAPAERVAPSNRAPPRPAPSLSKLCVLRI